MTLLVIVVCLVLLVLALRGAPYVPTHLGQVEQALDLLNLPAGSTVVDLGSGDGVFLKAAAQRGYTAIGYELNPLLCVISFWRCRRYRALVTIRWRDFWLTPLPPKTDAVFVFIGGPFVKKLDKKLRAECQKSNKPLTVVSYGFRLPHKTAIATAGAIHMYRY